MKEKYGVIFLDVDGVLNNRSTTEKTPENFYGVEDFLIERLKQIVDSVDFNVDIVLSSDWKDFWSTDRSLCKPDALYLNEKLANFGLEITDRTYEKRRTWRANGVYDYIVAHENITNYVILDDYVFNFDASPVYTHYIKTDSKVGLSDEDVFKASAILNSDMKLFCDVEEIDMEMLNVEV